MNLNKAIASWLGIGYLKGGGTVAAAVTCILIYFLQPWLNAVWVLPLATIMITLTGIYTGNQVEADWGKDSSRVVIDEVAGQMIALLFIAITPLNLLIGLILFRFFDILKPLGVRRMEKLPRGTGVMMDDVLAGIYANLVLQLIVALLNR
jgi:phosphatidylglycerophosphatase A